MTKSRVYASLAVIVTLLIFAASGQNSEQSSELSGGLLAFLMSIFGETGIAITHLFVRKMAHFAEFFLQSLFLSLSAFYSKIGIKPRAFNIAFAGLLTACTDEFLQNFSAGRSSQITDVFIDFSGTVTALLLVLVITLLSKRRAKNG